MDAVVRMYVSACRSTGRKPIVELLVRMWSRRGPGGKGRRGFEGQQGSPVTLYPTELLSGAMECSVCGSAIVKASGKGGGYYGCLGVAKGSCESRLLIRRTLAERVILEAVRQKIADTESLRYVFEKVEVEVGKLLATSPESIRMKQAELESVQRRIANLVDFVTQGRGSKALAEALVLAEQKADKLTHEPSERWMPASRRTRPLPAAG